MKKIECVAKSADLVFGIRTLLLKNKSSINNVVMKSGDFKIDFFVLARFLALGRLVNNLFTTKSEKTIDKWQKKW